MEISNYFGGRISSKDKIRKTKEGKIRIKGSGFSQKVIDITLALLLVATIYGFYSFDYKNINFIEAATATIQNIGRMFLNPKLTHFTFLEAIHQMLITLGLAVITTIIGGCIALFLGLFAATNLSNAHAANFIKGFVAFIRAVPTVLWVLIFAVSAGLGSVAAILGLSFHSIGYLIKAYSESFEEIDHGVIEALKASGASWWQIVFQAVLPSSATYLLAWTFMRFEINFANAIAMGAAAGAGGIGFELFMAGNFYFDVFEVGFITYLIVALAIFLEMTSSKIKTKYLY
jgi:phosphonate transport system permease protein